MIPPELWKFAEIDAVYNRLRPLTPYGRQAFEKRQIITDRAELERRYDRAGHMIQLIQRTPEHADRIRHHLKRIPLLPDCDDVASPADLFLVRRFLINVRALSGFVQEVPWQSDALLESLRTGDANDEAFYLADRLLPELASVRKYIREADASLESMRGDTLQSLRERYGLDFRLRDFLVIDAAAAAHITAELAFLEPFDGRHVIVRPVLPRKHFELLAQRERLVSREQEIETGIVAQMATIVRDQWTAIEAYGAAVTAIDVALAAAELANALGMTRPIFGDGGSGLEVHEARLVPLEEECGRRNVAYQSLNIALDTPHLLLRGSNMTGKTVVLKTIASMQLLAQLGLFVPAERFKTIVFDRICFIGGVADEPARGLSSFGREMIALRDAISARDGAKTLLLIDEFARTTGSVEAAALIAGLLDFLSRSAHIHSLFATHYASLPPFPRIRAYRTKGIDWQRLPNLAPDAELAERVEAINRCVSYELIPDVNGVPVLDAIRIAEELGIDASIIRFARRRVEGAVL